MSLIRAAFIAAAGSRLKVDKIVPDVDGRGLKTITVAGWHDDGKPFATTTAPFHGDWSERAKSLARDIIAAHHGKESTMAAPVKITTLGSNLRDALKSATARAEQTAAKINSSVSNLNSVIDQAEGMIKEIDAAAADIQSAMGATSNMGPSLGSSDAPQDH